jgi:hypothetical protein
MNNDNKTRKESVTGTLRKYNWRLSHKSQSGSRYYQRYSLDGKIQTIRISDHYMPIHNGYDRSWKLDADLINNEIIESVTEIKSLGDGIIIQKKLRSDPLGNISEEEKIAFRKMMADNNGIPPCRFNI